MTLCCCRVPVCRPLSPFHPSPFSNFSISTRLRTKRKHIKCAFKSIFESYAKVLPPPPPPTSPPLSVWTTLVLYATHWVRPASISGCCFAYAANCGNSAKWSSLLIAHNNNNGSGRHCPPARQSVSNILQPTQQKELSTCSQESGDEELQCTHDWGTLWGLNRLIF